MIDKVAPEDGSAWYLKGFCLHELGRRDDAWIYYRRAFELRDPFSFLSGPALRGGAWAAWFVGRYELALKLVEKALVVEKDNAQGFYLRGVMRYYLRRDSKAVVDFRRAMDLGWKDANCPSCGARATLRWKYILPGGAVLALVALVAGAALTSDEDEANVEETDRLYVQTAKLNVREGPGTSHPVIMKIEKGVEVLEVTREGNWVRVNIDGKEGWVSARYVNSAPTAP